MLRAQGQRVTETDPLLLGDVCRDRGSARGDVCQVSFLRLPDVYTQPRLREGCYLQVVFGLRGALSDHGLDHGGGTQLLHDVCGQFLV